METGLSRKVEVHFPAIVFPASIFSCILSWLETGHHDHYAASDEFGRP